MIIIEKKKMKKAKQNGIKNALSGVPLIELTSIIAEYNRKHNTSYTYGQFVSLASTGEIKI